MNGRVLAAGLLVLAAASGGCSGGEPVDMRTAAIAKCERKFGQFSGNEATGKALCTCMTDRLAEQGLEITDMLAGDSGKVEDIAKSCAASAGMKLPFG